MTFRDVWDNTLTALDDTITENAMKMWIRTLEPVAYENDAMILICQTTFQKEIVMSKYKDVISTTMSELVGFDITINVQTHEERLQTSYTSRPSKPPHPEVQENFKNLTESIAHPEFTFANFVVGESNRHAHAACLAVAQNPSGAYNPLFLYGSTGLGKTHLLYAIQNEIKIHHPEKTSLYIRSEDFTNDLIENLKRNTMSDFKNKYRSLDILMMDDIQFIAGKDSTQDEFFHTFETLYAANKQIILVSDRPPRDIQLLTDRLRSRFESGVIVSVGQPEYELKAAIIRQRCQFYKMAINDDVISFIANNVKSNIRQIEGVLKKMMAYALIANSVPNMAVAQAAIRDITNDNQPIPIVVDRVMFAVSNGFNVTVDELCSESRQSRIKTARQVAIYCLSQLTPMSLREIGMQFGGRDHSTIYHSINRIETAMRTNSSLRLRVEEIIKDIRDN